MECRKSTLLVTAYQVGGPGSGPGLPLQSQGLPLSLLADTLAFLLSLQHLRWLVTISVPFAFAVPTMRTFYSSASCGWFLSHSIAAQPWASLAALSNIWHLPLILQSPAHCCFRSFTTCHYWKLFCLLSLSPTRMKSSRNQEPCPSSPAPSTERMLSVVLGSQMQGRTLID